MKIGGSQYPLFWYEEAGDPLDYELQARLGEVYAGPMATGENLFSMQDTRNLIRHGGMRPDRDWLQFAGPQVSPPARGLAKRHEMREAWGSTRFKDESPSGAQPAPTARGKPSASASFPPRCWTRM